MQPTCRLCPLSTPLDGNRLKCAAIHHIGSEVVRADWTATPDCEDAISAYWAAIDAEITAKQKPKMPHHISCTYHVPSGIYQVRMQGKTIFQGYKLPEIALGLEVKNLYR